MTPFNVIAAPVAGAFQDTMLLSTGASYVKRPNAVPIKLNTSALKATLRPWPTSGEQLKAVADVQLVDRQETRVGKKAGFVWTRTELS